MRRLTLLLLATATIGVAVPATYSSFTDTTGSSGNSFTAAAAFCPYTWTLSASADSWVDRESPATTHGSDTLLTLRSRNSNRYARPLVRFTLPARPTGCNTVTSAKLRLNAASAAAGRTLEARRITANWTESTVNWNTVPATTNTGVASAASGTGWREWTVTSQVQAMYTAGNSHGFELRDANEGNNSALTQQFTSKEGTSNQPELLVTVGP